MSSAYSLLPSKDLITYEEGCKKGYHKVPSVITKRLEAGKLLTKQQKAQVARLEQLAIDAKLDPSERSPWLFDFEEEYEYPGSDIEEEVSVKKQTKKKISKKQNSKEKSALKKDGKEKKKRKRKSVVDEVVPKQRKKVKTLEEEIEEEVAEEDAMMDFDVSSESDKDDEDFSDKNDDQFESRDELLKKSATVEKKSKKKAEKGPAEKPRKKKEYLKSPEDIEQELFENCEEKFLPLMSNLDDAKSESEAKKLIKKIERDVKSLTPAFVRTHHIGLVVKRTRIKFKESDELNQMCKQLTSKMKQVYNEKLDSEPKGFQPKLRKKKNKQVSAKKPREKALDIEEDAKIVSPPTEQKGISLLQEPNSIKADHEGLKNEEVPHPIDTSTKSAKEIKPTKAKPARKSFSLAGMIERNPTPTPITEASLSTGSNAEANSIHLKIEQPEWTKNYHRDGNSFESNSTRKFAMEFLMDAVSCLPRSGNIVPSSVAHALEDALYKKYGEQEMYMECLHDICAAIAGKTQMGSLAQKIMAGSYATPLEVIEIPRKTLFQSFEGAWIT